MKIGNKIMVHGYKKNGWLYRTWEFPLIVENNETFTCLYLKNVWITSSEKDSERNFHSKNIKDSFWFFFKNEWFNIVATLVNDRINYYINLASPFIYEEDAIKYIDFDLDIKINQNGSYTILDENEFKLHKEEFHYGGKLSKIIEMELEKLDNKEKIKEIRQLLNIDLLTKLLKTANQLKRN